LPKVYYFKFSSGREAWKNVNKQIEAAVSQLFPVSHWLAFLKEEALNKNFRKH
jgi:hypothetical protein